MGRDIPVVTEPPQIRAVLDFLTEKTVPFVLILHPAELGDWGGPTFPPVAPVFIHISEGTYAGLAEASGTLCTTDQALVADLVFLNTMMRCTMPFTAIAQVSVTVNVPVTEVKPKPAPLRLVIPDDPSFDA
jgi:hypothetical protein